MLPTASASVWQISSAPSSPPRFPPNAPEPTEVAKKLNPSLAEPVDPPVLPSLEPPVLVDVELELEEEELEDVEVVSVEVEVVLLVSPVVVDVPASDSVSPPLPPSSPQPASARLMTSAFVAIMEVENRGMIWEMIARPAPHQYPAG